MCSASTSKCARKAARLSLNPKPSVPSTVNGPGNQDAIMAGIAFDVVRHRDEHAVGTCKRPLQVWPPGFL